MKKFLLKSLVIGLFLLAMPMKQFGQAPQFKPNPSTIDFDITEISLFDERIFFMYHLVNDGRFNVVNSENDGVFIVSVDPTYDGMDLKSNFDAFRTENAALFAKMDKEQASATAIDYKTALSTEITLSLMMDFYVQSRQNNLCANADPFCTDNGLYEFPAGVNAGSGEGGPYYSCLHTTPNPAWYYMRIGNPGNIIIHMYSTPSVDIDFCCWGPFEDPIAPCPYGLTSNKVVSCSYSSSSTENCQIPSSAQTGQYYILVITNYSNATCNITFSKTGGTGTTDCGIMPPLVNNDGPFCVGDDIHLTANGQSGATYFWTGPNGFSSGEQNPTIPSCGLNAMGEYTCTISIGTQSNNASTSVAVYAKPTADFSATLACLGEPTQFADHSTTNPPGGEITRYHWDFGDGENSSLQNPSHIFSAPGEYQVRLIVSTGYQTCQSEKTVSVTVAAQPVANAGADQTIEYSDVAELLGSGGEGDFDYQWEPADKVEDPHAPVTRTLPLTAEETFTLTVTNPVGGCSDESQVTIHLEGSDLTIAPSATPTSICEGESVQLNAHAGGGNYGNITYSWSPTTGLSDPTIATPIATPTQSTTYTCSVNDGFTQLTGEASVTVHHHSTSTITATNQCDRYDWPFGWNNEVLTYTIGGSYTERIDTSHGCDSIVTLELQLDYSPSFESIHGSRWVVGGSEFQYTIEQYHIETHPQSTHQTTWELYDSKGQPFNKWELTPLGDVGDYCLLYIYTFERDSIRLHAQTKSTGECECIGDEKDIWIHCGYHGVEETLDSEAVDIFPNPNDGNMTLAFDHLEGEILIKIYNITGMLADQFTLYNEFGHHKATYQAHRLTPGIYFFNIINKKSILTKKVIIID